MPPEVGVKEEDLLVTGAFKNHEKTLSVTKATLLQTLIYKKGSSALI